MKTRTRSPSPHAQSEPRLKRAWPTSRPRTDTATPSPISHETRVDCCRAYDHLIKEITHNALSKGGQDFLYAQKTQSGFNYGISLQPRYEASSKKGLCGLSNIGNTCFMNATLQCMLNAPGFADKFEQMSSVSSGKFGVAKQFHLLINDVRTHNPRDVKPSGLKSSISSKSRIFSGYNQQDAHEFLVHFLEAISIDTNRVSSKPKYQEMDYHEKYSKQHNVTAAHDSRTTGSRTT